MKHCLAIVILGASGDLTRKKLIPALRTLHARGHLPEGTVVIGSARTAYTNESFCETMGVTDSFADSVVYHQGIQGLKKFISGIACTCGCHGAFRRIVFFMALPPFAYSSTALELAAEGFGPESRLVIEKPFGYDYASANELNQALLKSFEEEQIFRIDHYLAKEAVQNILVFRFANILFDHVWNAHNIESIQINAFEERGVLDRGAYYDGAGIIRDMVQNHLLQLLCLVTMEAPVTLAPDDIKAQKLNILKSLRVEECVRGQYDGYREEKNVSSSSTTETYAEMRLSINTFRWSGMPVYIRTGKAMDRSGTEIGIRFREMPRVLYNAHGGLTSNQIIFKIQPAEGIVLDMSSKIPGRDGGVASTNMNFCYRDSFAEEIPEAYQRLLLDALDGDNTLFVSSEEIELAWQKIEGVLGKGDVFLYPKGTVPESRLGVKWIEFDKYQSVCNI